MVYLSPFLCFCHFLFWDIQTIACRLCQFFAEHFHNWWFDHWSTDREDKLNLLYINWHTTGDDFSIVCVDRSILVPTWCFQVTGLYSLTCWVPTSCVNPSWCSPDFSSGLFTKLMIANCASYSLLIAVKRTVLWINSLVTRAFCLI